MARLYAAVTCPTCSYPGELVFYMCRFCRDIFLVCDECETELSHLEKAVAPNRIEGLEVNEAGTTEECPSCGRIHRDESDAKPASRKDIERAGLSRWLKEQPVQLQIHDLDSWEDLDDFAFDDSEPIAWRDVRNAISERHSNVPTAPEVTQRPVAKSSEPLNYIAANDFVEFTADDGEKVFLAHIDGYFSCTCRTWKEFTTPKWARTCAHLRAYLGDAFEANRLSSGSRYEKL